MNEENKVNEQKDDLAEVENVEIAPLSDEDLDAVAGGLAKADSGLESDCTGCGGTGCCTTG
jgi:hypothetical protein